MAFRLKTALHVSGPAFTLRFMYQCKTPPISSRESHRVFSKAYAFLKVWKAETKINPPCVILKDSYIRQPVFLNWFRGHIEKKSPQEKLRRYRLLPCVRELLENTTYPAKKMKAGNYLLEGLTPDGILFRVIIKPDPRGRLHLVSCYPRK
jgi:hypothetical protein